MESFEQNLSVVGRQMNEELDRLLPLSDGPEQRLQEAMRYSSLDGGKRLRPFLVLTIGRAVQLHQGRRPARRRRHRDGALLFPGP